MKKFMENYLGVIVLYLVLIVGAYLVSTTFKVDNVDYNQDKYVAIEVNQ